LGTQGTPQKFREDSLEIVEKGFTEGRKLANELLQVARSSRAGRANNIV